MKSNDIDKLKEKLVDYYGSATFYMSVANVEIARVEQMSDAEIIEEAKCLNLVRKGEKNE